LDARSSSRNAVSFSSERIVLADELKTTPGLRIENLKKETAAG
jgi:hypothetical protein